jgi:23S rRNA (guanosine2251-2'-O)-methyltransferase
VYGLLPVLEMLRSGSRRVDRLLIAEGAREHRLSEIIDLARNAGIRVDKGPRENLSRHTGPEASHQGVVAFVSAADYVEPDEILDNVGDDALLVILDGIEDPRNFGAILRSAEGAGVDGIFIPSRRAVGMTDTVAKASAGAIEHVKVAKVGNINNLIEQLKQQQNIWVVGASGDAEMDHSAWDWTRPSALVMGAEGGGLHRLVAENCDVLVKIPMYGKINSLNVSVAAGVILFEARRQRSKQE